MPMSRMPKPQVEVEEIEEVPYDGEITTSRVRELAYVGEIKHKDLATCMGISTVTMSQRLTNKKEFKVGEIHWLASNFGVSSDWLLGLVDG